MVEQEASLRQDCFSFVSVACVISNDFEHQGNFIFDVDDGSAAAICA